MSNAEAAAFDRIPKHASICGFEDLSVLRSKTENSCSKQAHGASSAEESFVSLPIIEACS